MRRPAPERRGTWLLIGATVATIGSAIAFGYPAAADISGRGWWRHPVVFAGLVLLVIGGAAVLGVFIDFVIPRRSTPHMRFIEVERGVNVTPLPPLEDIRQGRQVTVRRFTPLRAVFANVPPPNETGAQARVWANIAFVAADGTVERTVHGRWAGEPQQGFSTILNARPDAGYWTFAPDGRPAALDIVVVEGDTGIMAAVEASEKWRVLRRTAYQVHVTLRAEAMEDLEVDFRLDISPSGEPQLTPITP